MIKIHDYTLELEIFLTGSGILDARYYLIRKALGKYVAPVGFEIETNLDGVNLENNQFIIKTNIRQEDGNTFEKIVQEIESFLVEELKKGKEGLPCKKIEIEKKAFKTGAPGVNKKLDAYEEILSTTLKYGMSELIRYKNYFNYMDIIPSSFKELDLDNSVKLVNEFWDFKRIELIEKKNNE